mmetsp:Transcript_26092/g.30476  ORF Transcript_26092/g.30476 Transcript_26092/m.30476 type:complete len:123 (+) Transcript_26092:391-759(+)
MDTIGLDFPNMPYFIDGEVRLTEPMAIIKYIAVKFGPESAIGATLDEKAEVEMMAHILSELTRQASLPCYMPGKNQQELGESLVHRMEPVVKIIEEKRDAKFLIGAEPTYADFMLFELCERV